jgi:hypothetical protein
MVRVGGGVSVMSSVIPRLMAFIDGENLVLRYEEMLRDGREPNGDIAHEPGVYVWHTHFSLPGTFEPIRANYYAAVQGDDTKLRAIESSLGGIAFGNFAHSPIPVKLFPRIFKKPDRSRKTSIADIELTVDLLSQVYLQNVDAVLLLSGDKDFAAVVRAVVGRGQRIFVGSFSSGRALDRGADHFVDLDRIFFKPPRG